MRGKKAIEKYKKSIERMSVKEMDQLIHLLRLDVAQKYRKYQVRQWNKNI